MKAERLLDRRIVLSPTSFAELVIWRLPNPTPERQHGLKYRLALVSNDICVLRYDNETGKGDHVHRGDVEQVYAFTTIDQLIADFLKDAKEFIDEHRDA